MLAHAGHIFMPHGARLRADGLRACTVGADLGVPGSAAVMVTAAAASLGGLDLLLNVAGTPLRRAGIADMDDGHCAGFSSDDDRRAYVAATPMGRGGIAEECVGAYLFLASHRLSSFVTGQTIAVNGGLAT